MSTLNLNDGNQFLTTKQASTILGLAPNTLEIWRLRGTGPRYLKLGRAVRYRICDLESYIESQLRQSTSEED